jgi:DNA-binding Xre family transcriptional regulator
MSDHVCFFGVNACLPPCDSMRALREVIALDVRALLADRGWTQRELAVRSGVSIQTVYRIVRPNTCAGTVGLNVETLRSVAQAFGMELQCTTMRHE